LPGATIIADARWYRHGFPGFRKAVSVCPAFAGKCGRLLSGAKLYLTIAGDRLSAARLVGRHSGQWRKPELCDRGTKQVPQAAKDKLRSGRERPIGVGNND
jgi:hypothetical protein